MADKEATVYIIDVGRSMGEKHNGRDESDLEWAMHYVWDKITSTVATNRKTATVGVVGLRTDETRNELGDEDNYENISVLQEIGQILMPDLRNLRQRIKLSNTEHGDAISALVIAIQMITKYCKKLKYHRKVILVTNGRGSMDPDDVDDIAKKLNEDGIELVVLGVDFDDPEYGFKEEEKDPVKAKNEKVLKSLVDGCNGVFGTLEQAIVELGQPRLKSTRPVTSYKGQLTLGDPEQYESAMCIDVERYPRTMVARAPTASQFVHNSDLSNGQASAQSSGTMAVDGDMLEAGQSTTNPNGLTSVKNARTYQVADDSAPGGKRDVDREELAKGYEYGRTAVHISESDENVTKLETKAALEIIGFVPMAKYDRYMNMSAASQIIAQRTNDKAKMAMSSLIHALFELEDYAVGRLVTRDDRSPVLVLLAPEITPEYECLIDVQLPFAEDFRSYRFPPLDRVVTVSGKSLKEHRNLPSDVLKEEMSNYVDRMDLATFGTDDEGQPAEYMRMEDTFSPVLHRIDQAVRWRAVHPTEPIPPPYDILTKFSHPPTALQTTTRSHLDKLISAASVKKGKSPLSLPTSPSSRSPPSHLALTNNTVPPKLHNRKRDRTTTTPLSGLDVTALLSHTPNTPHTHHPTTISPSNPIPEFKQLLATTEDASTISSAATQMGKIIESHIAHSFGDSGYGRALEEMRVMRDELVELEEPGLWNAFVRGLKGRLLGGELGGERREVWWEVRRAGLGLVDEGTSALSEVGAEEARAFLAGR